MEYLWTGTQHFLTTLFPQARQIITPWHDPMFDNTEYEAFSQQQGFAPVAQGAYGKSL
jgi:hypothetical protein